MSARLRPPTGAAYCQKPECLILFCLLRPLPRAAALVEQTSLPWPGQIFPPPARSWPSGRKFAIVAVATDVQEGRLPRLVLSCRYRDKAAETVVKRESKACPYEGRIFDSGFCSEVAAAVAIKYSVALMARRRPDVDEEEEKCFEYGGEEKRDVPA